MPIRTSSRMTTERRLSGLVALVDVTAHGSRHPEEFELADPVKKTMLLREIQHRVKNNLQTITALIRLEARNVDSGAATAPFDRLARTDRIRCNCSTSPCSQGTHSADEIDLGVYLSQTASAAMRSRRGQKHPARSQG